MFTKVFALVLSVVLLCSSVAFAETEKEIVIDERVSKLSRDENNSFIWGSDRMTHFETVETLLKPQLSDTQHVAGFKNGYFANAADEKNGIVRLDVDAYGTAITDPVNVAFVVDQSGSMNMDGNGNARMIACTTTCLNPDHYYDVPFCEYDEYGNMVIEGYNEDKSPIYKNSGRYLVKASDIPEHNMHSFTVDFGIKIRDEIRAKYNNPNLDLKFINRASGNWGNFAANMIEYCHVRLGDNGEKIWIHPEGSFDYDHNDDNRVTRPGFSLYWSPVNNKDGCYDRAMVVRQAIWKAANDIVAAGPDNRVAYVGFAEETVLKNYFSHNPDDVPGLYCTNGYNYTDYLKGFHPAVTQLFKALESQHNIIIFVTDGIPTVTGNPLQTTKDLIASSKLYGVDEIHAFGFWGLNNSGVFDELEIPGRRVNCEDSDTLRNEIDDLIKSLLNDQAQLKDQINNDAFDLYVDAAHPIVFTDKDGNAHSFSSLSELASFTDVKFDSAKNVFTMQCLLSGQGVRLSYSLKLKDSARYLTWTQDPQTYPTNKKADITYMSENHDIAYGADLTVFPPDRIPTTGDSSNVPLWLALCVASMGMIAVLVKKRSMMQH